MTRCTACGVATCVAGEGAVDGESSCNHGQASSLVRCAQVTPAARIPALAAGFRSLACTWSRLAHTRVYVLSLPTGLARATTVETQHVFQPETPITAAPYLTCVSPDAAPRDTGRSHRSVAACRWLLASASAGARPRRSSCRCVPGQHTRSITSRVVPARREDRCPAHACRHPTTALPGPLAGRERHQPLDQANHDGGLRAGGRSPRGPYLWHARSVTCSHMH